MAITDLKMETLKNELDRMILEERIEVTKRIKTNIFLEEGKRSLVSREKIINIIENSLNVNSEGR